MTTFTCAYAQTYTPQGKQLDLVSPDTALIIKKILAPIQICIYFRLF